MTDIELEFFKIFGIEPITYCKHFKYIKGKCDRPNSEIKCFDCIGTNKEYPEITDRVLLELICIYIGYERIYMGTFELDHFRRFILACLIDLYKEIRDVNKKERLKHQVRKLFEEEFV